MSNLNTFYSRLDRLYRYLTRHEGIELDQFYAKGRNLVKETQKWDMKAYTLKLIDDGQIRIKDVYENGEYVKRVLYTTDYQPQEGMP